MSFYLVPAGTDLVRVPAGVATFFALAMKIFSGVLGTFPICIAVRLQATIVPGHTVAPKDRLLKARFRYFILVVRQRGRPVEPIHDFRVVTCGLVFNWGSSLGRMK